MKLLFKEYSALPEKYIYPYRVYAEMEADDTVDDILSKGFLASRISSNLFYLARSLRVDLHRFSLNSENRRILRKTEYLKAEKYNIADFQYDYTIGKMAFDFYNKDKTAGKKKIFRPQTVKRLFNENFFNALFVYKGLENENAGYTICLKGSKSLHYAYPFYKDVYRDQNIGMGMMISAIMNAKESGLDYFYLGTIYTKESLYKLQFEGLEYFDGVAWNKDLNELKSKING